MYKFSIICFFFEIFLEEELLMGFQDVALLYSRASFSPHFLLIVVRVKTSYLKKSHIS